MVLILDAYYCTRRRREEAKRATVQGFIRYDLGFDFMQLCSIRPMGVTLPFEVLRCCLVASADKK